MTYLVQAFGLCLKSGVPIPGGLPVSETDSPDVTIAFGEVAGNETGAETTPYRLCSGGLLFSKPGIARYLCTAERITIEPLSEAAPEDTIPYLIATALPAVLWLRGELMLHAAAAILPGSHNAVAIAGVSGSGKSALLHELLCQGITVVAEDSCCLRFRGTRTEISGLPGTLFLRDETGQDVTRRPYFVPMERTLPQAHLGAVLFLDVEEGGSVPKRLSPIDGLEFLLRHRHRPRIEALLGLEKIHLHQWLLLVRTTPMYLGSSAALSLVESQQVLSDRFPSC